MSLACFHNLPNGGSDNVHFISGEPIAARKITWRTSWPDIASNMRQCVINPVQTTGTFCGSTVYARHDNQRQNFGSGHVAGVYSFISLAKKNCAALVASPVSALPFLNFCALLWRLLGPSIGSIIPTALTFTVAFSALIRQPMRTALVCAKKVRIKWLFLSASVASSHVGTVAIPHRIAIPHWQLPWKDYP